MPRTPATVPAGTPSEPDLLDHRFVYNGDAPRNVEAPARTNRPVRRKRQSPFAMISLLLLASMLIVFYIWNKISVNRIARDVDDLQNQYQKILNANDLLRAEINQKSRLDRIEKIATEQLKMSYPKQQPAWFELDQEKLKKVEAAI